MNTTKHQSGLSMIELMVALVISSFLILGVTQIYIDNKRSYAFQQNQAENLEGARFTLLVLQQELAKAGYRRRPDQLSDQAFPASNVSDCNFSAGEAAIRTAADSICIRYQIADEKTRDCIGNLPTNTADLSNPYTSATEITVERIYLNSGELTCKVTHTDAAGGALASAASASLVNGVADLRYELGVGSASDPRAVVSYTKADTTLPILTIRYTVLMRSSNSNLRDGVDADTALANWKTLTGATSSQVTALKSTDKGQLYQVSQSAVMLRNLMP